MWYYVFISNRKFKNDSSSFEKRRLAMYTLQRLLVMALMLLLPLSASFADEKPMLGTLPAPVKVHETKFPITLPSGEYELISTIMDFAPGAGVATHKHGGYVLVQVLSGEVTVREKGKEIIKKQGESWTENPGNEHSVINAGNITVRVAVSMLLPKGADATTMITK
jgi:quercetin dioxygenase-like cupin family protein